MCCEHANISHQTPDNIVAVMQQLHLLLLLLRLLLFHAVASVAVIAMSTDQRDKDVVEVSERCFGLNQDHHDTARQYHAGAMQSPRMKPKQGI